MLTLLLAAVLLAIAVAGAELVRSTCRKQLMATVVLPPRTADIAVAAAVPAAATAD